MKRVVATVLVVLATLITFNYLRYETSLIDGLVTNDEIDYFVRVNNKEIELNKDGNWKPFEIRGVNMGLGYPGKWPSDFSMDKKTFLRWFKEIKEMGANTVRVYDIPHPAFYDALYEYNINNDDPLYLIQGVWVNDYLQNSRLDAYDNKYLKKFIKDCKTVVDVIHGNKTTELDNTSGKEKYESDVSNFVIAYIIGSEWRETTVVYTDNKDENVRLYEGTYMTSDKDASPFENMLCEVEDKLISYEVKKYSCQRPVSFSNWIGTDPFEYVDTVTGRFDKVASIDAEHIVPTGEFKAGTFASYHLYPYFNKNNGSWFKEYFEKLNNHHKMPVVIAEYGVSTSRAVALDDSFTGFSQNRFNEQEQGEALVQLYKDIKEAGCSGSLVASWQDEWFKRSSNTSYAVDILKSPFWGDVQTDNQSYGLMSFDPGDKTSVCYVDGEVNDWNKSDEIFIDDNMNLSMKYDEMYVYFMVNKKDYDKENDVIYIPIDTTPKSGSNYCSNYDIKFDRFSDFLIVIDGEDNSEIKVQERYNVLDAMFSHELYNKDAFVNPPKLNSNEFTEIRMIMKTKMPPIETPTGKVEYSKTFNAGKLKYGNANPKDENYDSLADFSIKDDYIEIRIPWQILNFANPSEMKIHDDYYKHYGVEEISINKLYAGVGVNGETERIKSGTLKLKGWGSDVKFHERLKKSYYILQDFWQNQLVTE